MSGLYIGSTTGFAGKNLLSVALGLKFQQEGYKVGYMKPVGTLPKHSDQQMGDDDAFFMQDVLGLNEDLDLVTPVLLTQDLQKKICTQGHPDLLGKIREAYNKLSQNKDIILICGSGSYLHAGKYCNVAGLDVSRVLKTKVILIDRYFKEFYYDYLISCQEILGDDLIGTVFNCVPESENSTINEMIIPLLERKGIKCLGILPKDPLLNAIKVGDLAKRLKGKIISMPSKSDMIVENFLIGTMQAENFMIHFKKTKNSAVIVGGDRSDLQLVALEGKCHCLILTGNLYPNDIILSRSEALEIPIIVVREGTYPVSKKMENILESIKLRDRVKINHGAKIVNSLLDFQTIKKGLALED